MRKLHHDNQFRPQPLTVVLFIGALILSQLLAYKSVHVAGQGQDDARNEAALARIAANDNQEKINELQSQLQCQSDLTAKAVDGLIANSIAQDSMLLGGFEGGDVQSFVATVKTVQAALQAIATERARIQETACK